MNKKIILAFFCLSMACIYVSAQEVERDLQFRPEQLARYNQERNFEKRTVRGGNLSLPFFDDFSRYSLATDDPNIPMDWQRWSDADVFINSSMPIAPLTIGVATLDGLGPDGCAYNMTQPDSYGGADSLTSLPIDLVDFTADDSVKLMFYYEGGGLGNSPDEGDSLVLDFYSPFGAGAWIHKWSADGSNDSQFQQVIIDISEEEFLLDGFRMRFRNYSTLSGNLDHWHLDYIVLADNFNYEDCNYDDLAMQYPNTTLLKEYTAMPWTHFITDAPSFMDDNISFGQRNLGPTANIVTGFSVEFEDQQWDYPNADFNTFGNGCSEILRDLPLTDFVYDTEVNDTCAVFDVSIYATTTDAIPMNDTTRFQQVFTNYYAYDDGSAERAYALNTAGGQLAVRYFAETPDTLLGLFMHWTFFQNDQSDQTILLRAWTDESGLPGDELNENFTFYSPEYYCNGYSTFGYYAFDNPSYVNGTFYVGFVQDSNEELNLGNDKNGTTNQTHLFYQHGGTDQWQQSEIGGSVMIRPVFKAGKSFVWNGVDDAQAANFQLYPNPAGEVLNIVLDNIMTQVQVRILDVTGSEVRNEIFASAQQLTLNVSALPAASYLVEITDTVSRNKSVKLFLKQ